MRTRRRVIRQYRIEYNHGALGRIVALIFLALVIPTAIACTGVGGGQTEPPADIDATVEARVRGTQEAAATLTPAATPTLQPTVTLPPTPQPTATLAPTATLPPPAASSPTLTLVQTPSSVEPKPTESPTQGPAAASNTTTPPFIRWVVGPKVPTEMAEGALRAAELMHQYAQTLGMDEVNSPTTVYMYHDFDAVVEAHVRLSRSTEEQSKDTWSRISAMANEEWILIRTSADWYADAGPDLTWRVAKTIAHELVHHYSFDIGDFLLGGGPQEVGEDGPRWLFEGIAEFLAYQALSEAGIVDYNDVRNQAVQNANRLSVPLSDLETSDAFYGAAGGYSVGLLAAELLAYGSGQASLLHYYSSIHPGNTWRTAFETAFGMTLEAFYEHFNTHSASGFSEEEPSSPTPTLQPTLESMPLPTPTGVKLPTGPTNIRYDIADNVSAEQVEVIATGLQMAQDYLDSELGGGIPEEARNQIGVKIVATGLGNQEPGGGGSCCTAFRDAGFPRSEMRLFFDVAHPGWKSQNWNRRLWTSIHEYTHVWQHHLGCISQFHQPLGNWLNEGIAQYLAFETMTETGELESNRQEIVNLLLSFAQNSRELSRPLRDLAGGAIADIGIWPGNVGFLALNRVVPAAPGGIMSLRTICEEAAASITDPRASGTGMFYPEAFETAFGVSLEDFYADFEEYRKELNSPTPTPTPTPTGVKLPTGPTNIRYDIADNVSTEQVEFVAAGLRIAQDFLDSELGGGISEDARHEITIKLVATGRGDEEPGGGGACCTASSKMQIFLDFDHTGWGFKRGARRPWTLEVDAWDTVVHEYAHLWNYHLGCLSKPRQPLGNWLVEGMAQFIANETFIKRGDMQRADVDYITFESARGLFDRPLRNVAEGSVRDLPQHPGRIGALALSRLVPSAPNGMLSLRTICEEVAAGATVPEAFETAFGVSLEDFYADFEEYRADLEEYRLEFNQLSELLVEPKIIDLGFIFDVDPDVPAGQMDIIKSGFQAAQNLLDRSLDGGIPKDAQQAITVEIVADEQSNIPNCCTILGGVSEQPALRPFFNVAHSDWTSRSQSNQRWKATREFMYLWQHQVGCLSYNNRPLGIWLNEGIGFYLSFEGRIGARHFSRQQLIENDILFWARSKGQLSRPLQEFESHVAGIWPSHVGYLAVHRLVQSAPGGILSLRTVCEEAAGGASAAEAFETAFGVSLEDFYADFEEYRKELLSE